MEYFVYEIHCFEEKVLVYQSLDRLNARKFAFNHGENADWELRVYDSEGNQVYTSYEDWLPF